MASGKNNLDIIAIVPARLGSKRLPRKNVLPLAGKPLVQWTLDIARASGVIDMIVVTSDDDEVLDIAKQAKATAIRRPKDLASDTALLVDAVVHVLDDLKQRGITTNRIMLLQPTSPLRSAEDIQAAVGRMDSTGANSVISVCETDHSPMWSNTLPENGSMDNFIDPKIKGKRSQDFPTYYRLNGAIYFIKTIALLQNFDFFESPSVALVMPAMRSIDIDSYIDFKFSEHLLS